MVPPCWERHGDHEMLLEARFHRRFHLKQFAHLLLIFTPVSAITSGVGGSAIDEIQYRTEAVQEYVHSNYFGQWSDTTSQAPSGPSLLSAAG